jgi:hypothetical protein
MPTAPTTSPYANYSTTVAALQSIGEVHKLLAKGGASAVAVLYGDGGYAEGLTFTLRTAAGPTHFALPVRLAAIRKILGDLETDGTIRVHRKGQRKGDLSTTEHAERVAWRIVLQWLQAQLQLIEAGLIDLPQIMLPYLIVGDGAHGVPEVLYQRWESSAGARAAISSGS